MSARSSSLILLLTLAAANPGTLSSAIVATSAASYATGPVAPGMIVSIWGTGFAAGAHLAATQPLPAELGQVRAQILDSRGATHSLPLFFVSPEQINALVPEEVATGGATLSVIGADGRVQEGSLTVESVAPGLFAASGDGQGLAVGSAVRVREDGAQVWTDLCGWDPVQRKIAAVPINLGSQTDQTIIVIYGTGLRFRSGLENVQARVGGEVAEVLYAGAQSGFAGLDQLNIKLPHSLFGKGTVSIAITVDGKAANPLSIAVGGTR